MVNGKLIVIDGQFFNCRLLQVSKSDGVPNEWDKILDETGEDDTLWHWNNACFWGQEKPTDVASRRAVRGYFSARYWNRSSATGRYTDVGFRPVLEPLASDNLVFNCTLDEQDFCWSTIPNGKGFCPILQPTQKMSLQMFRIGNRFGCIHCSKRADQSAWTPIGKVNTRMFLN